MKQVLSSKIKRLRLSFRQLTFFPFVLLTVLVFFSFLAIVGRRYIVSQNTTNEGSSPVTALEFDGTDFGMFFDQCVLENPGVRVCEASIPSKVTRDIPLLYLDEEERWLSQKITTAEVKKQGAAHWYSIEDYEGSTGADFQSGGGFEDRTSQNSMRVGDEVVYFSLEKAQGLEGYLPIFNPQNEIVGRIQTKNNSGQFSTWLPQSTESRLGIDSKIPIQIIMDKDHEYDYREPFKDVDTDHYSLEEPTYTKANHCSGVEQTFGVFNDVSYRIDDSYLKSADIPLAERQGTETSGIPTITDRINEKLTLRDIIDFSNLAETIGFECEKIDGKCKIPTDLGECNPCDVTEDIFPGGNSVTKQQYFVDTLSLPAPSISDEDPFLAVQISYRKRHWGGYDNVREVLHGSGGVLNNSNATALKYAVRGQDNEYTVETWYLSNPDPAANKIQISWEGTVEDVVAGAKVFYNVDQEDPVAFVGQADGPDIWNNAPSVTIPSREGYWVFGGISMYTGSFNNVLPGSLEVQTVWGDQTINNHGNAGYVITKEGENTSTLNWNATVNWPWAITAIAIKPASADGCLFIERGTGEIVGETDEEKEENKQELIACINEKQPELTATIDPVYDLEIPGFGEVLLNAAKALSAFTDNICVKNVATEGIVEQKIWFPTNNCSKFFRDFDLPIGSLGSCRPDPSIDIGNLNTGSCNLSSVSSSSRMWWPFGGVGPFISNVTNKYLYSSKISTEDILPCSMDKNAVVCKCDASLEVSPLVIYLWVKDFIKDESASDALLVELSGKDLTWFRANYQKEPDTRIIIDYYTDWDDGDDGSGGGGGTSGDGQLYLPFSGSKLLFQGWGGTTSHKGNQQYAIDFASGEKKFPILAPADGVVIGVKEDSNASCNNISCYEEANYVILNHPDLGIQTHYLHLSHNSVTVEIGDAVQRGQIIGRTGQTGWSTGDHLHFHMTTSCSGQFSKNSVFPNTCWDSVGFGEKHAIPGFVEYPDKDWSAGVGSSYTSQNTPR